MISPRPVLLALALLAPALAGCLAGEAPGAHDAAARTLVVLAPDGFFLPADVAAAFEAEHGARVQLVPLGDAEDALAAAERGARGDVLVGVDALLLPRARASGVLAAHEPPNASSVPAGLVLDDAWLATPVLYRDLALNVDGGHLDRLGLAAPGSLRELARPGWNGTLVVPDPATSREGLEFLLLTVAAFGEGGAYSYRDWWADAAANGLAVEPSWEEAYFARFSGGGYPGGDRAAAVAFEGTPLHAVRDGCRDGERYLGLARCPGHGRFLTASTVAVEEGVWRRVEGAGVLANASEPALARAFVDFLIEPATQEALALANLARPVHADARAPDLFELVPEAERVARIEGAIDEARAAGWLEGYREAVGEVGEAAGGG